MRRPVFGFGRGVHGQSPAAVLAAGRAEGDGRGMLFRAVAQLQEDDLARQHPAVVSIGRDHQDRVCGAASLRRSRHVLYVARAALACVRDDHDGRVGQRVELRRGLRRARLRFLFLGSAERPEDARTCVEHDCVDGSLSGGVQDRGPQVAIRRLAGVIVVRRVGTYAGPGEQDDAVPGLALRKPEHFDRRVDLRDRALPPVFLVHDADEFSTRSPRDDAAEQLHGPVSRIRTRDCEQNRE